jgi:hypothetical protein
VRGDLAKRIASSESVRGCLHFTDLVQNDGQEECISGAIIGSYFRKIMIKTMVDDYLP